MFLLLSLSLLVFFLYFFVILVLIDIDIIIITVITIMMMMMILLGHRDMQRPRNIICMPRFCQKSVNRRKGVGNLCKLAVSQLEAPGNHLDLLRTTWDSLIPPGSWPLRKQGHGGGTGGNMAPCYVLAEWRLQRKELKGSER